MTAVYMELVLILSIQYSGHPNINKQFMFEIVFITGVKKVEIYMKKIVIVSVHEDRVLYHKGLLQSLLLPFHFTLTSLINTTFQALPQIPAYLCNLKD